MKKQMKIALTAAVLGICSLSVYADKQQFASQAQQELRNQIQERIQAHKELVLETRVQLRERTRQLRADLKDKSVEECEKLMEEYRAEKRLMLKQLKEDRREIRQRESY